MKSEKKNQLKIFSEGNIHIFIDMVALWFDYIHGNLMVLGVDYFHRHGYVHCEFEAW